ncbi:TRP-domain-containing protein [Piedraia hortae CBS 480.64]|uniref:TRP-domain-containing protein n=1 Tax=Piedraia hortae CBS 480.64 TaxID=1314780 RepID=A0A6A7C185_9PEZI|nr:TRP-domain-containing protein [Piedraia hortae CBS 480.64]
MNLRLLALAGLAAAERMLYSDSLNNCQASNQFSATQFDVVLTPANNSLAFSITGVSTIRGNITVDLVVIAYGLQVYETTIDPCEEKLSGLCPMSEGKIELPQSNVDVPQNALAQVPGIAYTVPDLDAKVQVYFNMSDTGRSAACVEAELSNGKTVNQRGVAWTVAVISGLALLASAITSGLGHSNTAAHVAANALSLFGFFQAQALFGMVAVRLPPVVSSWTQNFQWSMGIIRVGFIQNIATWYQRATGGKPTSVIASSETTSVQVLKRGIDFLSKRAIVELQRRSNTNNNVAVASSSDSVVVRGISRVGFVARIETSNIFLTGYMFFLIFLWFVVIGIAIFKIVCEVLTRTGNLQGDKFHDFRNGWTTVLKGILFRIVIIGFPQMVVLCFWEITRNDSAGEMALAIMTVFTMILVLAWASTKVIRLAQRSITMHKNPAYILYSDPISLNKWGFLYVQFKAAAYYFIVPFLIYMLAKCLFVALAQGYPRMQAIALVIIELLYLAAVAWLRPYMDKKTNAFNIAIAVVNFISAIFILVFSGIFAQPGIVTGVMGVIFFVYNAVVAVVLLVIVLIASIVAVTHRNPDTRYQPMRDDRGSFIKSQSQLTTELDALGATARGENHFGSDKLETEGSKFRIDSDEWSSPSQHQTGGRPQMGQRGGNAWQRGAGYD